MHEGTETTNFTVVDADGNVVTNTYTINDLYGSRVTAKGTGVLLNDEMDDFAARPGKPNMFGLVQGEKNAVQPAKRPLSSMTPTIVMQKDGSVWFALGPGGPEDHYRGSSDCNERHRLWHEHPAGHRRSSDPPTVASGRNRLRAVRDVARYAQCYALLRAQIRGSAF